MENVTKAFDWKSILGGWVRDVYLTQERTLKLRFQGDLEEGTLTTLRKAVKGSSIKAECVVEDLNGTKVPFLIITIEKVERKYLNSENGATNDEIRA